MFICLYVHKSHVSPFFLFPVFSLCQLYLHQKCHTTSLLTYQYLSKMSGSALIYSFLNILYTIMCTNLTVSQYSFLLSVSNNYNLFKHPCMIVSEHSFSSQPFKSIVLTKCLSYFCLTYLHLQCLPASYQDCWL